MTSIRFAATIALGLAVSACGRGDADPSARKDSASAPPPISEIEGHHDAAHAADTTLTLRHDGIGPLRVGMTAAEARAALGHLRLIQFDPAAPADPMACGHAMSVRLPEGVRIMMEGARVVRVEVDSGTVRTAEGARIGDSEDRIKQLYPGRVTVHPHKYTDGHYLQVRPEGPDARTHLLIFETDGRVVERFRGGRRPQVEYVEGCA